MAKEIFGWDIGGAHLKVARLDADGQVAAVRQIACPLWRGAGELGRAAALLDFPVDGADAVHAVTMTGELCDIFPSREAGVREIIGRFLDIVADAATVRVFAGFDGWLDAEQARGSHAPAVASANWLALAGFVAELASDAVLIDIGSTTSDLLPLVDGDVQCLGRDDASRLAAGELVYTGIVRTPVAAVCDAVPFRGLWQPLAAETFATMSDVYRLLGRIAERHDLMPAADGRGKDLEGSARRLMRMLGRDLEGTGDALDLVEPCRVAAVIAQRQQARIVDALDLVLSRAPGAGHETLLIGAGVGSFVVEDIAAARGVNYRSFDALLGGDPDAGESIRMAAPAVAAAKLAWMTM